MWGEWKLPIAYETLDTAIERYLPGPSTTWVEFTREQISSGGAIYHLHQRLLGDLGKITIHKVSATETTMLIERPEYPRRNPTPEEMAPIMAIEDKEEYYRAFVALDKKIWAEQNDLFLRRVEHQEKVIRSMFDRMAHDSAFQEARGQLEAALERMAEQRKKPQVYVPTRPKDLLRWRAVWSSPSFRMEMKRGATYETLRKRIENLKYELPSSPDTIRRIIRAGMAGLLEPIDFEQLDRLGLKRKH